MEMHAIKGEIVIMTLVRMNPRSPISFPLSLDKCPVPVVVVRTMFCTLGAKRPLQHQDGALLVLVILVLWFTSCWKVSVPLADPTSTQMAWAADIVDTERWEVDKGKDLHRESATMCDRSRRKSKTAKKRSH